MKRNYYVGLAFALTILILGSLSALLEKKSRVEAAGVQAPMFEVDPLWPKPLPSHWLMGMTIGVSVDAHDNIWIIHRQGSLEKGELHASTNPPIALCCAAAPPVLEFDQDGNLLHHWGGPGNGYDWPDSNHGITIDYKGNVWIGGNGRGKMAAPPPGGAPDESASSANKSYNDNMVLKFTQEGKFLMQIGKPNSSKGSNDIENLRLPAKTFIDKQENEVYVADGYGNHRVIVFDADTGKYKRHWGAYGHKPDDADPGNYIPTLRRRNSSATRCTAPIFPWIACCTFATAPMIACRYSNQTAPLSRKRLSPSARSDQDRPGTSPSPKTRSKNTFTWSTAKTTVCTFFCVIRWKCSPRSAKAAGNPANSTVRTASPRIPRATFM